MLLLKRWHFSPILSYLGDFLLDSAMIYDLPVFTSFFFKQAWLLLSQKSLHADMFYLTSSLKQKVFECYLTRVMLQSVIMTKSNIKMNVGHFLGLSFCSTLHAVFLRNGKRYMQCLLFPLNGSSMLWHFSSTAVSTWEMVFAYNNGIKIISIF